MIPPNPAALDRSDRSWALDVFRGLTMLIMILVNMAGVNDNVYAQLDHAPWNGWTLTDTVFPNFLFAVGMAMSFSFRKHLSTLHETGNSLLRRVLTRSAILFGIGLLINGYYKYDLSAIRILGVLQRIALAYLATSLIVIKLRPRVQWLLAAAILIGYWIAMNFIPVPGFGAGVLTREGNLGAFIDRAIFGASFGTAHLYAGDSWKHLGDPEGLFSTLPAIVSTLIGYFTGEWLAKRKAEARTSVSLATAGLGLFVLGHVWGWSFPITRKFGPAPTSC